MQLPNNTLATLFRAALGIVAYVAFAILGFHLLSHFYTPSTAPKVVAVVATNGIIFILPVLLQMAALRQKFPLKSRPLALIGTSILIAPISIIAFLSFCYALSIRA